MLANTSSANLSAAFHVVMSWVSMPLSMVTQMVITISMAGTIHRVISVSFHCTAKATMKAAKKVVVACTVRPNFSDMPWLTRLPPLLMLPEMEPGSEESKYPIS